MQFFCREGLLTHDNGNRSESEAETPLSPDVMRSMVMSSCVQWESDLKGFLLGVLRNREFADDVFQKTVIRAIESANSARQETLRGWLFRIALNESRQLRRQQKRDSQHLKRFSEQFSGDSGGHSEAEWLLDENVVDEETVQLIQQSLFRLPEEQQEVIRRRIYDNETFEEIAEGMQRPLGTVLTWMRRGLLRLKQDSGLRAHADDSGEP